MPTNEMDVASYSEFAEESIRKSIEMGNYEGAHVQLCSYLLEMQDRFVSNEINRKTWRESVRLYRRLTMAVMEESNIQQ